MSFLLLQSLSFVSASSSYLFLFFFFLFFFLAFSLTIKVTNMMAICQDICWQGSVDFTYIDFNIFLPSMSFSSKGSMRSVKPLQTHYLSCIYQLVFPLSQWDSFLMPTVITGRLFLITRYHGGHKKALIQKASDKHSLRMMLSLLSTVPKLPSLIIKKNNNYFKERSLSSLLHDTVIFILFFWLMV